MSKNKGSLIVVVLAAIICYIVFKDFLILKKAYFFYDISSDGYYGLYPTMYLLADYISHGIPSWSFKMGMGQNIFPFMLRDPFDIFLYITGKDHIVSFTIYKEVIKIILSGWVFFLYLRLLKLSDFTAIAGSMLFAFCAIFIQAGPWFMFSFEGFNFAVFLLGFELLFQKRKGLVFSFAVFLFCISMPFNLYLYGVFMLLYAIFRHFQAGTFNLKAISGLFYRMIISGIIGILVSGPILLENVKLLLNSPRGSRNFSDVGEMASMHVFQVSDNLQLGTAIMRFFSNDILGSGSNFKGWARGTIILLRRHLPFIVAPGL
jgi:hypothetical protein